MVIQSLRMTSFRAHERSSCDFGTSVNLFHGPNGAGKTNILEAIHYLCLGKSFVTSSDRFVVRKGARYTEVEGTFVRDDGRSMNVRMAYVPGEGKRLFLNRAPLDRLADVVGELPVVVFSPEDASLTAGGPEERRRFMDNLLSQARPIYLDTLLKYRRVLKQRNRLLARLSSSRGLDARAVLASWDHELVRLGSYLVSARMRFVEEYSRYLEHAYRDLEAVAERPTLQYVTIDGVQSSMTEEEIGQVFRERLDESAHRERRRELTLVGPHRDELVFRLDGMLVRRYASQGQHRTFGMSMKLAKYFYLYDQRQERPVLLLDDVFDQLDRSRSAAFLELLQSDRVGQSIITATDVRPFEETVDFLKNGNAAQLVKKGSIGNALADRPYTGEVAAEQMASEVREQPPKL